MKDNIENNTPIHICLFADERSIHTRRWVLGLREMGHRVDLITLMKDNNDIGGISLGAGNKLEYFLRIGKLKKMVASINPDIFHSHHASSFGFLASFVSHPRKVLSVWGYDVIAFPFKNVIYKAIIKRALSHASYITATSRYLKDAVLSLNNRLSNIEVIPFGVDLKQFKYVERTPGDLVTIGIAKSLRPKYGIDILIRAFHKLHLKYDNLRLKIAGKGDSGPEYKKLVADLNLNELVEFTGFIEHNRLPAFLADIDIFAMPSNCLEAFGVAALEASAAGLPVVAAAVGGVPEVVNDGQTGFLVKMGVVDELAAAIEKLIVSFELRGKMGRAGREFVENNYRWENNLLAMDNLYRRVISGVNQPVAGQT